jgi:hypothetical protein
MTRFFAAALWAMLSAFTVPDPITYIVNPSQSTAAIQSVFNSALARFYLGYV